MIKKIINSLEHGDEIVKEIEESVPYSLINLYLNDTQQNSNQFLILKNKNSSRDRKKVIIYREANIDDDTIKNNDIKKPNLVV